MASINASTTSTGLISTGDASGSLDLQGNGATGLTINSNGKVVFANTALSTASAGIMEYDGRVPYFTPLGTQRGVVPGMQYYVLNSGLAGSNATGSQNLFNVGVTLSSNTFYFFESVLSFVKTAGTTSHTLQLGFGGTSTLNSIQYTVNESDGSGAINTRSTASVSMTAINTASATVITAAMTASTQIIWTTLRGVVSINAGGTFIPQYALSAAPGGAYTLQAGSYFLIYPIGAAGSNVSVGTWA